MVDHEAMLDVAKAKLKFYAPVMIVMAIASVLVYFSILSSISTSATVVEPSEGSGAGGQAWSGLLNALIFFIPALIGGFFIFLLFKYRKRGALRILFGGAMFIVGWIATAYFLFLIWVMIINHGVRVHNVFFEVGGIPIGPMGPLPITFASIIISSILMGGLVSYTLFAKESRQNDKNLALLYMGAIMGAFLSTLIPTWALAIFMVILCFYDLYAVKRGPIKKIVEMTMEDEIELERQRYYQRLAREGPSPRQQRQMEEDLKKDESGAWGLGGRGGKRSLLSRLINGGTEDGGISETDMIMNNMTYAGGDWDLGIGDLVFYSVLSSHALMLGIQFIPEFGILAPFLFFTAAVVGILIGFRYTIKKLEENLMLPGLPVPILLSMTLVALVYTILAFIYL